MSEYWSREHVVAYLKVGPFAYKVHANAGDNSWLILQT